MDDAKQKKTINALYIALVLSTIFGFMPMATAQLLSLLLISLVLMLAYMFRGQTDKDTLLYNHMTYMIGTIWISSIFLVISLLIMGYWVYTKGDATVIDNAMINLGNGVMLSEEELNQIGQDYIDTNLKLLITASAVSIGPSIIYLVYRLANGFSRACKGYRIANPKSWL